MGVQDGSAAAWSYAWWLTGDEEAATAAVRAAASRTDMAGVGKGDWLTALLREIRAAVGPVPTMCPASELALLHDIHGLPLDQAAQLVAVDLANARTELAHGRLEALTETVIEPCVHPERLGGLAVGNPTDIAHARQCPSCGRARELLDRGRVELRELAGVAALWDSGGAVIDEVAQSPAPEPPLADAAPPATMGSAPQDDVRSQRQLLAMSLAAVAVLLFLLWVAGGI